MTTTLGQLRARGLLFFNDGYRTKSNQLAASGFQIIRAGDINNGAISATGSDHVSEEYASAIGQKILRTNDVILTTKGTIGRTALVNNAKGREVYSPQLCFFRPDPSVLLAKYLYFWLSGPEFSYQSSFMKNSTDMAPYISLSQLADTHITIPPIPEQKAIADVLGALDDKIAANRKLITIIDKLMVSLVENLTPDAVLSQLASLRRTPIQPAVMPPTVSHYSLPRFDEAALPGHEANKSIKSSKFSFDHPAVLLSKLNPRFPRIWNVPTPETNAVASTEFLVLEPKSISTAVLWALLSTARASEYLQEHVAGTTGSHQRFKPGDAMAMPMPSRISPELERTLSGLGDRAVAARYESRTLAELRDTLLPALMDGTIRVKDAETHVEEVL